MKKYQLVESEQTKIFFQNIVNQTKKYVSQNMPLAQAVARSLYQQAGMGGYFWRSVFGGKFIMEDVIKQGPSCIDYSRTAQIILKRFFNINSTIKETQLVLVKNHQYLLTANGEVLDLIVGIPEFPEGYFSNEEIYLQELNKINSQKNKLIFKQIKAILFPKTRKKLC